VLDYLRRFGAAARRKIKTLLWEKLSNALDDDQKRSYVKNLLQEMKKDGTIRKAKGQTKGVAWELSNPAPEAGD
jgi:ATP-dependent DNA helicase RecG